MNDRIWLPVLVAAVIYQGYLGYGADDRLKLDDIRHTLHDIRAHQEAIHDRINEIAAGTCSNQKLC